MVAHPGSERPRVGQIKSSAESGNLKSKTKLQLPKCWKELIYTTPLDH